MSDSLLGHLQASIRTVANWPEEGVMFRDITPILLEPALFAELIEHWRHELKDQGVTKIVGIDARGFILGAPLALQLGVGFVPVRKKGKLPAETTSVAYTLEYGEAEVEIHLDALDASDRVVIIDDLIATGGTMLAAAELVKRVGAHLHSAKAIIDLPDLKGSEKIFAENIPLECLLSYPGL